MHLAIHNRTEALLYEDADETPEASRHVLNDAAKRMDIAAKTYRRLAQRLPRRLASTAAQHEEQRLIDRALAGPGITTTSSTTARTAINAPCPSPSTRTAERGGADRDRLNASSLIPRSPRRVMSFVDLPDVFIGSTDDAHTFVVLNRRLRDADRLLTDAGFTAREHNNRTIYLLPPGTPQDANERAGIALYGLLAHTHDFVDLSWTTRWNPRGPLPEPDLRVQFADGTVTATAETDEARSLLEQHGFTSSPDGSSYRPPSGLDERGLLGAVVSTETYAYIHGVGVRVDLGIPTPDAIPAVPRRTSSAVPGSPATGPARGRTR
ncbi:hypothetical protein ACFRFL_42545 [Streptomyces sp. NPDC056708]|uniref:hypothetical protein n=1 Tax=unclassified Streptomyces TaxID=2593676 RepID=UPI00367B2F62